MSARDNNRLLPQQISRTGSFLLLFQRVNLEDIFSIDRQLPIGIQFLTADFNPRLHETGFATWKFTCQQFSICYAKDSLVASMFYMDVRNVVFSVVREVHADDNAVKHGKDWHFSFSYLNYILTFARNTPLL